MLALHANFAFDVCKNIVKRCHFQIAPFFEFENCHSVCYTGLNVGPLIVLSSVYTILRCFFVCLFFGVFFFFFFGFFCLFFFFFFFCFVLFCFVFVFFVVFFFWLFFGVFFFSIFCFPSEMLSLKLSMIRLLLHLC